MIVRVLSTLSLCSTCSACMLLATALATASCSTSKPAPPKTLPPPIHAYRVAQLERPNGNAAYVTCRDCPAPTRKTLPGIKRPAAPPPQVVVQAAPPPAPKPPRVLVAVLQFDLNSARLTAPARAQLDAWAALLRLSTQVHVTGYTDDLGGSALNTRLSEARSEVVLSALRALSARSDGGSKAPPMSGAGRPLCCYVSDNRGEAHRRANRRAEVHITVPEGPGLDEALKAIPLAVRPRELGAAPAAAGPNARAAAPTTNTNP